MDDLVEDALEPVAAQGCPQIARVPRDQAHRDAAVVALEHEPHQVDVHFPPRGCRPGRSTRCRTAARDGSG